MVERCYPQGEIQIQISDFIISHYLQSLNNITHYLKTIYYLNKEKKNKNKNQKRMCSVTIEDQTKLIST